MIIIILIIYLLLIMIYCKSNTNNFILYYNNNNNVVFGFHKNNTGLYQIIFRNLYLIIDHLTYLFCYI